MVERVNATSASQHNQKAQKTTGHSFRKEENLRHRTPLHKQNVVSSTSNEAYLSTPPHRYSNASSNYLDDADVAAGTLAIVERTPVISTPSSSALPNELRYRSYSQPVHRLENNSLGSSLIQRFSHSIDSTKDKSLLELSMRAHPDSFLNDYYNKDMSLRSPIRQQMDRGVYHGVASTETEFLSLPSRSSESNYSEFFLSHNDELFVSSDRRKKKNTHIDLQIPSSKSYPPYELLTIDELSSKSKCLTQFDRGSNMALAPDVKTDFFVVGCDITNFTRQTQFLISAAGTFISSLLYGYLQELISVKLCHRKLGLFLAATQFVVYSFLSYFLCQINVSSSHGMRRIQRKSSLDERINSVASSKKLSVPLVMYIGVSALRAIDMGMTNLAMQYVNYPAKTLIKSTRIVFTMVFGILVTKKRYGIADFVIVGFMVAGLAIFMHADMHTSAVFQPLGVVMLTISLLCDGAISNMSEYIMNRYEVGQDEFIFRLYSVALFFVTIAAAVMGDLRDGLVFLTTPGTFQEIKESLSPTWSISAKIFMLILFSTSGLLTSSFSAAITKSFGALTMSITTTARKAATIFLSFTLFPNECTLEHIAGIALFMGSLVGKSLRASGKSHVVQHYNTRHNATSEECSGDDIMSNTTNQFSVGVISRRKHNIMDVV